LKECKFSINYGFGSISPFDTPELIEMLRKNSLNFQYSIENIQSFEDRKNSPIKFFATKYNNFTIKKQKSEMKLWKIKKSSRE